MPSAFKFRLGLSVQMRRARAALIALLCVGGCSARKTPLSPTAYRTAVTQLIENSKKSSVGDQLKAKELVGQLPEGGSAVRQKIAELCSRDAEASEAFAKRLSELVPPAKLSEFHKDYVDSFNLAAKGLCVTGQIYSDPSTASENGPQSRDLFDRARAARLRANKECSDPDLLREISAPDAP